MLPAICVRMEKFSISIPFLEPSLFGPGFSEYFLVVQDLTKPTSHLLPKIEQGMSEILLFLQPIQLLNLYRKLFFASLML